MSTNKSRRQKVAVALAALGAPLQNDTLQTYRIMTKIGERPETKLRTYHIKLAVALLDMNSSVDIEAISPYDAITVGEYRKQLRYLLDPTTDFEECDDKPLRAAELNALLEALESVEIPEAERRPNNDNDDSLGAVYDQFQALRQKTLDG